MQALFNLTCATNVTSLRLSLTSYLSSCLLPMQGRFVWCMHVQPYTIGLLEGHRQGSHARLPRLWELWCGGVRALRGTLFRFDIQILPSDCRVWGYRRVQSLKCWFHYLLLSFTEITLEQANIAHKHGFLSNFYYSIVNVLFNNDFNFSHNNWIAWIIFRRFRLPVWNDDNPKTFEFTNTKICIRHKKTKFM